MCMFFRVYAYMYVYACMYVCMRICMCICKDYECIHMNIYICVYACICVCIRERDMNVYMCIYYECMCVQTHVSSQWKISQKSARHSISSGK